MAFLVIAAFLLTNKVYSPQYVLWLLPFVVLARPRWRDWLVFTAGELIYFVAIWWHLAGVLAPGDSSADRIYWLAVIIRLGTQLWVVALVVRDILRPAHDPVRARRAGRPDRGSAGRGARCGVVAGVAATFPKSDQPDRPDEVCTPEGTAGARSGGRFLREPSQAGAVMLDRAR